MAVKVTIQYIGYASRTGCKTEVLSISENIDEAYPFLVQYLNEKYQIQPPFLLMMDSYHIIGAVKRHLPVKEGSVFKVLPFISGG